MVTVAENPGYLKQEWCESNENNFVKQLGEQRVAS